jgi:hypothetical protein
MSQDSFTEVTRTGWFSRLGGAVKGVFAGFALVVIAVVVLFWNEGRAVKRARDLDAGAGALVQAVADPLDPANEGALMHFTGEARTNDTLTDRHFQVSANALRLRRDVEMFQWTEDQRKETRRKVGGGTETKTTYSYRRTWSAKPIRSSAFRRPEGHENPADLPFHSETQDASLATVGAFELPGALVARLSDFRPVAPPEPADPQFDAMGDALFLSASPNRTPNPADPQVGDVRLTWSAVEPGPVSVIGVQRGSTLEPWTGPSGSALFEIRRGTHSAEAMLGTLEAGNRMMTWILRGGGTIALFIAFGLIFGPLGVLADVLPPVGSLVRLGTGTVSLVLTVTVAFTTIGLGWLFYRPLIGIPLLVCAAAGIAWLARLARKRGAEAPVPAGAEEEADEHRRAA